MAARNGGDATSMSWIASDFQRTRSEDVGLSSAAKSETTTLPFHDAFTGALSGTSSATRPFTESGPFVISTFTCGSTYGFSAANVRSAASSCPENATGCVATGPLNARSPAIADARAKGERDLPPRTFDRLAPVR